MADFLTKIGGLFGGPQSGLYPMSEDERRNLGRAGLLQAGLAILANNNNRDNPLAAISSGLLSGVQSLQQGQQDYARQKYVDAINQRTVAGMDRNNRAEQLASRAFGADGKPDMAVLRELATIDAPMAKSLLEFGQPEQESWTPAEITDPQNPGNVLSVIHNGHGKFRYPDGTPVFSGGLLSPESAPATPEFGILSNAVEQTESGGNPYAVSSKGAVGPMQTMPGTLVDPGFGVVPARNNSVDEQRRVGQEYLKALTEKYGVTGGLAAYNWGPGNWDRALASNGNDVSAALSSAPTETRNYVPRVMSQVGDAPPASSRFSRPRYQARSDNASEESFGQPQEVVDPSTGKPALVQFGNRGTIRPVTGYGAPQNAAAANKEAMQSEKQVTSLSKRLSDENVPFVDTTLNTIEGMLREYTDTTGKVTKDIPGYGRLESFTPDAFAGQDARDLRQTVAGLANTILKSRSGAAVTDTELRRFLQEAGTNKGMPEQQLVNGVRMIRKWFDAQKQNIRGGYSPAVLQQYYQNSPENEGLLGAVAPKNPAGGSDNLLNDARNAIMKGASKDAVRQRLIQMGKADLAEQL